MTQRTAQQNKALHKGCELLANKLNDAGLDMKRTLKPWVDIPWTGDSVRVFMFNSIASIMFDGKTSHELSTTEIQEVWQVLNRHLPEQHSIEQEWPDRHG
jgi:hypothetical protein